MPTWIDVGGLTVTFDLLVDQLTAVMLLVVTGVGCWSTCTRWATCTATSATRAVLRLPEPVPRLDADPGARQNLLVLFLGWELVGLSSYLLIGFWFEKRVRRGRQEGVHHQPGRRRRLHGRDVPRLRDLRDAGLPRDVG
jgi:NADH:ubiquinone oxidoreductase subunit 4 (subunit M)